MSVMQININDEDITSHAADNKGKKEEPKKEAPKTTAPAKPALSKNPSTGGKQGGYGNLFG